MNTWCILFVIYTKVSIPPPYKPPRLFMIIILSPTFNHLLTGIIILNVLRCIQHNYLLPLLHKLSPPYRTALQPPVQHENLKLQFVFVAIFCIPYSRNDDTLFLLWRLTKEWRSVHTTSKCWRMLVVQCKPYRKVACRIHFLRDNGLLDFLLDKVQKPSISKCNIASFESPRTEVHFLFYKEMIHFTFTYYCTRGNIQYVPAVKYTY